MLQSYLYGVCLFLSWKLIKERCYGNFKQKPGFEIWDETNVWNSCRGIIKLEIETVLETFKEKPGFETWTETTFQNQGLNLLTWTRSENLK